MSQLSARPTAMAARAPHFALVDFRLNARNRVPIECEFHHRSRLGPDVVELEHKKIVRTAVNAARARKVLANVSNAAALMRQAILSDRIEVASNPPRAPAPSGAPSVAIRADNLALRDLIGELGNGRAHPDELRHFIALRPHMVEFKDVGVRFAAIGTCMRFKEVIDVRDGLENPLALGVRSLVPV